VRGRELFPVIVALVQWGDRWMFGAGREPIRLLDKATRSKIQDVAVQGRDGRTLEARDVTFAPGTGASEETRAVFADIAARRAKRD
jgi:hypothetical protein